MKHAMANRRRNRNDGRGGSGGGNGGGGLRPQQGRTSVFDSNGPDVRIRGTAFQIVEKYQTLARDSASAGDRVLAENYLQHAEHYQRMINSWAEDMPQPSRFRDREHPQPDVSVSDAQPEEGAIAIVRRPSIASGQADEDLGLPASILGRTSTEMAAAD